MKHEGVDGKPWNENWDAYGRPSNACCLEVEKTRATAREFLQHLIGFG